MSVFSISQAVDLLESEEVVVLPTETVYGLAGLISSPKALESIFSIKDRPFFDPLIVHVYNLKQAVNFAHFDKISQQLASHFWPGPLSLVLPKKEGILDLITSGGLTVALRSPNHPVFQQVLKRLKSPLAAPSANRFSHTSPTRAEHISGEFSTQVPVLDGGPCQLGIESTVVEMDQKTKTLKILRPGCITREKLMSFFREQKITIHVKYELQNKAPGHLKNHYQPTSPLVLIDWEKKNESPDQALLTQIKQRIGQPLVEWTLPGKPELAARRLYGDLRLFSKNSTACYICLKEQWFKEDRWKSLMDRLTKAAHYLVSNKKGQWLIRKN